ncbi:MAG: transporter [Hyphomicrobiales bacterium]
MRAVILAVSTLSLPAQAQVGPNIDDLAKELANPGAANATLNFKFEYRTFDGDLPDADDQDSFTTTFQPVFPFVLSNGNNLIFRPAFPYVFGQPVFANGSGRFETEDALGEVAFDLLYAGTREGWTLGAGIVGAVPTGSDISSDNWLLGPSALAVKTEEWGVWGFFPFHNEKTGGSGPDVSITSLQYFLFYGLGRGWQIGTGPTLTYDWKANSDDAWTVPVGLQIAKTTAFGNQLVKLTAGIERNVVAPDAFASDWKFTFTFSPVISNPLQPNPPTPPMDAATRAAVLEPLKR